MEKPAFFHMIGQRASCSSSEAKRVYEAVESHLLDCLNAYGSCKLPGIGVVELRITKERFGRNPKTGAAVHCKPKLRARLRPSRILLRNCKTDAVAE